MAGSRRDGRRPGRDRQWTTNIAADPERTIPIVTQTNLNVNRDAPLKEPSSRRTGERDRPILSGYRRHGNQISAQEWVLLRNI